MSQAGSQAAAFYREVVLDRTAWTIADPGGYPAPMTAQGLRAMPFWSSLVRAQQAIKTPAYQGFEPESLSLEEFVNETLPILERDGLLVGINWSGSRSIGFDLRPNEVSATLDAVRGRSKPAKHDALIVDPGDRVEAGQVVGDDDRALPPAAQATETSGRSTPSPA